MDCKKIEEKRHLVIMAGGIGSRFWPISTPDCPKQFVDVLGCGKSLLQMTVDRFKGIVLEKNIWIVTSKDYGNLIYEQLPNVPKENILFEPFMRNTAPCIAYVGNKIKKRCLGDAEIIVSPADHSVTDTSKFQEVIIKALEFIKSGNNIVTIGITPTIPHTGYGYIAAHQNNDDIKKVISFKEKPSLEIAQNYLREGNYYWNSGLFLWKLSTLLDSFKMHASDIASIFESIEPYLDSENEDCVIYEAYNKVPKISVDYAIMEKAQNIYTLPSEFGWSDLGTWSSLREFLSKDKNGNAAIGNVEFINSNNCTAHIKTKDRVVVKDINDTFIIDSGNGVEYYRLNENGNLEII